MAHVRAVRSFISVSRDWRGGFGGGTRFEIIPLRNSRTIPSAKLIFQRRPCSSGPFRRKSPFMFILSRLNASWLDFPEQQPTDSGKKTKGERGEAAAGEKEAQRGVARKHGGGPARRVVGEEEEESRRGYKYTRHLQLTFTG